MTKTQLRWFAVKTLYRLEAIGKPRARDRYFDSSLSLVEERVVVFRAKSFEVAMRKAEREAERYARGLTGRNPYGQRRRLRFLGAVNAYDLFDRLADGAEVYSDTFLVSRKTSRQKLIDNHLIRPESKAMYDKRRNFLDEAFNKPAGA